MKSILPLLASVLLLTLADCPLYSQIINTIAGGGDGGAATGYSLYTPKGITADKQGNVYVSDYQHRKVKRISPTGTVSTYAGTGQSGYYIADEGKKAVYARISAPAHLACDTNDNVYILDVATSAARVWRVNAGGKIKTVLGGGSLTSLPNTATQLGMQFCAIALAPDGTLYAATKVPCYIGVLKNGIFSAVSGTGAAGYSGDGGPATAASVGTITAMTCDKSGNLYFFDQGANKIRKIDTAGIMHTIAGNGTAAYSGDGGPATAASFNSVAGLSIDSAGRLLVSDGINNIVRLIDTAGRVDRIAGQFVAGGYSGDGGPALSAQFNLTGPICTCTGNSILVCDVNNNVVRKVDQFGSISTYAGNGAATGGDYKGDGGPAISACLYRPQVLASGAKRNLLFTDVNNHSIRSIDTNGVITTFAGNNTTVPGATGGPATATGLGTVIAMATDKLGNTYYLEQTPFSIRKVNSAGTVSIVAQGTSGFTGDGGPATAARFNAPSCLATDKAGNLFVADAGNKRIRMIDTSGTVMTIAGSGSGTFFGDGGPAINAGFQQMNNITVADSNRIYVEDNYRIRMIDPTNTISTIAGTGAFGTPVNGLPAVAANLGQIKALTTDSSGNLYIADGSGIRMVNRAGIITTIAGGGSNADGCWATTAYITPTGLFIAPDGSIICTEYNQNTIRQISYAHLDIASADTAYCYGSTARFQATISNCDTLARRIVYRWQLNDSDMGTTNSIMYSRGFKTGDSIYCIATDSLTGITLAISNGIKMRLIATLPQLSVRTAGPAQVCAGDTVQLTATIANGGSSPVVRWYRNGLAASTDTSYVFRIAIADTVRCLLISNAACRLFDSVEQKAALAITDTILPTIHISSASPDSLCLGTMITLNTTISSHGPIPKTEWFRNGRSYSSFLYTLQLYPEHEDSIYCRLTDNGKCVTKDTVYSNGKKYRVQPTTSPVVSLIINPGSTVRENQAVTIQAEPVNCGSHPVYLWRLNGRAIDSTGTITFTPLNNDYVECTVKSDATCQVYDQTVAYETFKVDNKPVFPEDAIYPNPNTGTFRLYQPIDGADGLNVFMNIYNTFGQLVDQQTFVLANSKIDTKLEFARKLPEGVYYLDLYFFSGRKTLKFVVKY